ncbi:MAG: hypothetical protein ACI4PO_00260, partial [Faecousia sp.]
VIARQVGHGLFSGRTDPLTTFLAALMQISAQVGHRAFLQCRLPILCLYMAHQRMYFRFWICT